ncbi:MAG: hypothetical protein AB7G13_20585 [Lautropia sp.]
MSLTVVLLIAVAAVAAFVAFGRSGPVTVVDAVVVAAVFVPDRAADGTTRITVRTGDGRSYTVRRPGRQSLKAGDAVRVERVGTRLRRLIDGPGPATPPG